MSFFDEQTHVPLFRSHDLMDGGNFAGAYAHREGTALPSRHQLRFQLRTLLSTLLVGLLVLGLLPAAASAATPAAITIVPEFTVISSDPRLTIGLNGVVTDSAGDPVAGVTLNLSSSDTSIGYPARAVQTDSNGAYVATFETQGGTGTVQVCATAGPISACTSIVVRRSGAALRVYMTASNLHPAVGENVMIQGRVVDFVNNPVANQSIKLTTTAGSLTPVSVISKPDGSFTTTLTVSTTEPTVIAAFNGVYSLPAPMGSITLNERIPANLTISASRTSFPVAQSNPFMIAGRVTDASNLPVPFASITLTNSEPLIGGLATSHVQTASDGSFQVTFTPGFGIGSTQVCSSISGTDLSACVGLESYVVFGPAEVILQPSASSVAANGSIQIKGTVADLNHHPVPDRTVTLTASAGSLSATQVLTDENGSFSISFIAPSTPGPVTISAAFLGQQLGSTTITVLGQPDRLTLSAAKLHVESDHSITFTGRVVDASGNGIPNQTIHLAASAGDLPASVTTGADGSFTATFTAPHKPGKVMVTVAVPGTQLSQSLKLNVTGHTPPNKKGS